MDTIVGPIKFDAGGERANQRVIMAQFRGVKDKDLDQFRSPQRQVIIHPTADKTGDAIFPYEQARKS
jgi:branched-chain amino acid transport system substrate-binding protein